jgi:hypothetical protein
MEHMEQGSREWLDARIGCVTMSNASKILAGGKGITKMAYLAEVASEILTSEPAERFKSWDMERGSILEPYAGKAYQEKTGFKVRSVGIGYLDEMKRIAASPDLLVVDGGKNGGAEIKCQMPKSHMRTLVEMENPKKFEEQMQGCMWVFGVEFWDYCSFCPQFKDAPLVILRKYRNEDMIDKINKAAHLAIEEIDKYVALAKKEKVSSRILEICDEANEILDVLSDREIDIL